ERGSLLHAFGLDAGVPPGDRESLAQAAAPRRSGVRDITAARGIEVEPEKEREDAEHRKPAQRMKSACMEKQPGQTRLHSGESMQPAACKHCFSSTKTCTCGLEILLLGLFSERFLHCRNQFGVFRRRLRLEAVDDFAFAVDQELVEVPFDLAGF